MNNKDYKKAVSYCYVARDLPGFERSATVQNIIHVASYFGKRKDFRNGWKLRELSGHTAPVCSLAVSQNGKSLISGEWDNKILLWDVGSGNYATIFNGLQNHVVEVAFSKDGQKAVSVSDKLQGWNLASGEVEWELPDENIKSFSLSHDGSQILFAADNKIYLWSLAEMKTILTLDGHTMDIKKIAHFRDDAHAISASADRTIRIWDFSTGKCTHILSGSPSGIDSFAVLPGSNFIFSIGGSTARLWDVFSKRTVIIYNGHQENILSVSITPDGKFGITTGFDNTVRVWKLTTGECIRILKEDDYPVTSSAVLPNGCQLFTGCFDGKIKLGNLIGIMNFQNPDQLLQGIYQIQLDKMEGKIMQNNINPELAQDIIQAVLAARYFSVFYGDSENIKKLLELKPQTSNEIIAAIMKIDDFN